MVCWINVRSWISGRNGFGRSSRLIEQVRKALADDARFAPEKRKSKADARLMAEFNAALADDLDTPRAVRALRTALRQGDAPAMRAMQGVLLGSAALS